MFLKKTIKSILQRKMKLFTNKNELKTSALEGAYARSLKTL